jgi:hypothetical protein
MQNQVIKCYIWGLNPRKWFSGVGNGLGNREWKQLICEVLSLFKDSGDPWKDLWAWAMPLKPWFFCPTIYQSTLLSTSSLKTTFLCGMNNFWFTCGYPTLTEYMELHSYSNVGKGIDTWGFFHTLILPLLNSKVCKTQKETFFVSLSSLT